MKITKKIIYENHKKKSFMKITLKIIYENHKQWLVKCLRITSTLILLVLGVYFDSQR
jgi:hypothetical protein